jgi:single-strand DNA-binding protein
MYQKVTLAGYIGSSAELRYTPQGTPVSNFSVAADSGWGDSKVTTWFRVTIWGKLAESLSQYLTKGKLVLVEGELKPDPETGGPRTWTGSDGVTKASFEVTAREVRLLGGKAESGEEPEATETGDELPF